MADTKLKRRFSKTFQFNNQIAHEPLKEMVLGLEEQLMDKARITKIVYVMHPGENGAPPQLVLTYWFKYKRSAWKELKKGKKKLKNKKKSTVLW